MINVSIYTCKMSVSRHLAHELRARFGFLVNEAIRANYCELVNRPSLLIVFIRQLEQD